MTMEATSTETEARGFLTTVEEIHCHKARIFSLLATRPVIRAWKDAICDGTVYLGQVHLPKSYADRYFGVSVKDISRELTFRFILSQFGLRLYCEASFSS